MARDFFINGECLVRVKGNVNTTISSLSELGLSEDPIVVTPDLKHTDLNLDAWGSEVPADVQFKLAAVTVRMKLIHFDRAVLDTCLIESMAGAGNIAGAGLIGMLARAGRRMGGGNARFAANNHFIGLNLTSPSEANKPWRFYSAYLTGPPMEMPLGTEKSVVALNWRVIPYTQDPWGGGTGADGVRLWDHSQDT